jgi:hypothetical protein
VFVVSRRVRLGLAVLLGAIALATTWAAMAPVPVPASREQAFIIPKGTWERRMAGEPVEILPQRIRLTLGMNDVLLLQNHDVVPQTFGPALLMPGQSFRLPFELASEYDFACSAHASGQMKIVVDPFPDSAWGRLRWRVRRLLESIGASPPSPHTHPPT